jgi:hypothetical protein
VRARSEDTGAPVTVRGTVGVYEGLDDPASFGNCVANWDMSDPLGAVFDLLRRDENGLGWWGSLPTESPTRPT